MTMLRIYRSVPFGPTSSRATVALLIVLATIPFFNSLTNGFARDDEYLIVQNPLVKHIGNLPLLFTSSYFSGYYQAAFPHPDVPIKSRLYRPVVMASYMLNYLLGGLNPIGYHVVNIVLHAAVCVLVYVIGREVLQAHRGAFVAAALFAVHPLHTEAVTGISGRPELLAVFFGLLSWRWYMDGRRGYLVASMAAFALALLSKEQAVMLPFVLLLSDIARAKAERGGGGAVATRTLATIRQGGLTYGAYGMLLAMYFVARVVVLGESHIYPGLAIDNPLAGAELWPRIFTAVDVAGRYLHLMIWPVNLSADYSYNQIPVLPAPWTAGVLWAVLAWGLLMVIAVRSYYRGSARAFLCVSFAVITYLPASNCLIPIGTIMGERLFYAPSIGLCWLAGLGWEQTIVRWQREDQWKWRMVTAVATTMLAVLLMGLGWRTHVRNRDWQDDLSLFRAAVEVSPRSVKAHAALADSYAKLGRIDQAIPEYQQALGILPHAAIQSSLAAAYLQQGQTAAAITAYGEAVRLDPLDARIRTDFGFSLLKTGEYDRAVDELQSALAVNPNFAKGHYVLGLVYAKQGLWSQAATAYQRAVELQHDFMEAAYALGLAFEEVGQYEKAASAYEQALKLKPDYRIGHLRLADLYRDKLGDETRAAMHRTKAEP